jgi:hypothetical protein
VQCSAVQCSAVQCSAVQCSAVQCSAVQCGAVQCSAVQCVLIQFTPEASLAYTAQQFKGAQYDSDIPLLAARPGVNYHGNSLLSWRYYAIIASTSTSLHWYGWQRWHIYSELSE